MARAFISSEFLLGDMKVDLKNLPVLLLRLQIQLNSHGMRLDTEKFTEMVRKDNDVGSILKICGDMLSLDDKGDIDPTAMNIVTIDQQYSKGSVDAARGKAPQLLTKPTLEHRNTVVRDVKRGLSMKGIEISQSSDESSVDSRYSESSGGYVIPTRAPAAPRTTRQHGRLQSEPKPSSFPRRQKSMESDSGEKGMKSKTSGKFATAAKMSRYMGGTKKEETESQPRAQSRSKLKSAAMLASMSGSRDSRMKESASSDRLRGSNRGSSKYSDDDSLSKRSITSKGSSARRKASKFSSFVSKKTDDDSSLGSRSAKQRTRSVDKARSSNRSIGSVSSRKSQSQPRSRRVASKEMDDDAGSLTAPNRRKLTSRRQTMESETGSASSSGRRIRRINTMGVDEPRRRRQDKGSRGRVRDDSM